jgi:hypothetical protein
MSLNSNYTYKYIKIYQILDYFIKYIELTIITQKINKDYYQYCFIQYISHIHSSNLT